MASTTDIWAVTPVYSATLLRAAATVAGAGDVPLLSYQPLDNGAGYKLFITSVGDSSGMTFTIVGYQLTIILLLQVLQLRELVQVILVLGPSSQTVWLFLDVD